MTHARLEHSDAALRIDRASNTAATQAAMAVRSSVMENNERDVGTESSEAMNAKENEQVTARTDAMNLTIELEVGQAPGSEYTNTCSSATSETCWTSSGTAEVGRKKGRRAGSDEPTTAVHHAVQVRRRVADIWEEGGC